MAFGDLRGTLSGSGTAIVSPVVASGSVAVQPRDLVVVMVAEAAKNTATTVTDNLGQVYTATNAGTLSNVVGGRAYYRAVTVAGTLTAINVTMVNSSADYAVSAAVFAGPCITAPLDRSPANGIDEVTPFSCPPTGVLTQSRELIFAGLALFRGQTAVTATAPLILAVNRASAAANSTNSVSAAVGYQITNSTGSVTPVFSAPGSITGGVEITASFRSGVYARAGAGSAVGAGAASGRGTIGIARGGTAVGQGLAQARSFVGVRGVGTSTSAGAALARSHSDIGLRGSAPGVGLAVGAGLITVKIPSSGVGVAHGFGEAHAFSSLDVAVAGRAIGVSSAAAVGQAVLHRYAVGAAVGVGTASGSTVIPTVVRKEFLLRGYLPGPVSQSRSRDAPSQHGSTLISMSGYRNTNVPLSGNLGVP